MPKPCKSCPWRIGNTPDTIPNFKADLSAKLSQTCRDDGLQIMACHKSREGREIPCAGFVLQVGPESIGLRFAVRRGAVNPDEYETDAPLHATFEAMHRAQGVVTPPRNRVAADEDYD